jgi:hypothetical protein
VCTILPFPNSLERSSLLLKFIHEVHQRKKSVWSSYHIGTKTLTTLGCRTYLVSVGSQRWQAECTEHLGVVSVLIHVRFTFGVQEWGTVGCLNVIRNCCKWYRTLCKPTRLIYSGLLYSSAPKIKNKISSEGKKHIFTTSKWNHMENLYENTFLWHVFYNIVLE